MPEALSTRLFVYTYKRGLLRAFGHDLCLTFRRIEGRVDGGALTATVYTATVSVVGAVVRGRVDPAALSDRYVREIENTARREVLAADRWPTARFAGRVDRRSFDLAGTLSLHGVSQPVAGRGRPNPGGVRVEMEFAPSRFGIAPYRAVGGGLKLEDRVRVEVEVCWGTEGPPEAGELMVARGTSVQV